MSRAGPRPAHVGLRRRGVGAGTSAPGFFAVHPPAPARRGEPRSLGGRMLRDPAR
ncbi:MAG: hypothetical protein HY282_11570 [Nitrospirae bacterium]|nr:hypothetical protein [Candidatus Manganitrophaceae bacterium]